MMTNKEQRKACLSLAMMLEDLTDSLYIDMTDSYCEVTIHCDKLMKMIGVKRFLNYLPYELDKSFRSINKSTGSKFYSCHIRVIGMKKI